jgi:hypothetical protein
MIVITNVQEKNQNVPFLKRLRARHRPFFALHSPWGYPASGRMAYVASTAHEQSGLLADVGDRPGR